jgi:hypothetical protein
MILKLRSLKQAYLNYMSVNKTGNVLMNVTWRSVRVTIVVVENAISITYCECVSVVLVIQHAMRMRRIILSSVGCLTVPYFF